ncbi:hypothetical protein FD25_GL000907 [Levilactobacillus acidifarinae DSM 19394]|uniref:Uncharacterized protein n=1 Tax=Levilactobacillus acidifarinae DSM 19394 = JCM 15949 TaxID=1423715 RepID=A0A0R1LQU2_9LACO|nr:hypothetical protein FD25_GL000907 [Levilactobacillus acidifarinae DSM 19394]
MLLSLVTFAWGGIVPVKGASDVQQSQYEVQLTPENQIGTGNGGSQVGGSTGDSSHPVTNNTNGQGATVTGSSTPAQTTAPQYAAAAPTSLSGRLPQLSEQQWTGFGLLGVIILGLMFWVWKLSRKNRRS